MHCLWEIIDNAVDEALAGLCTQVDVTLHPDGSAEVHDDGRGIPVDKEPKTGLSGVEVVFTKLHAGGKFGGGSYAATGGLHGVGASVVNALSARLDVEVDRSPATQAMSLPARRRRASSTATGPEARSTPAVGPAQGRPGARRASPAPGSGSGPTGRSSPRTRRSPTTSWSPGPARPRSSCPGLELAIRDLRGDRAGRGVVPPRRRDHRVLRVPGHDEPVTDVLRLQGSDVFTETVPLLDDKGHMTPQDVERELGVDVALRWGTGYDTEVRSFVNVIATPKGGTHVAGFEAALTKTFNDAMRAATGAQGQRHRRGQGRRARGADRGGHRPAGRAAVRGPDQGGARHAGRTVRRTQGGGRGAEERS